MARFRSFIVVLLAVAGCLETVREDRTITWRGDGENVAFQHGTNGVYVARADGGGLERVHAVEGSVVTSTPCWSPDGSRMIYATAEATTGGDPNLSRLFGFGADPAGDPYGDLPVVYTCWLREGDETVALFDAGCGHAGYVAASLALRWHPSGESIYFIQQAGGDRHALREFDLSRRTKRPVGVEATDLVFDFAPGGQLVCVTPEGLRIRDARGWWRVPCRPSTPRRAPEVSWLPVSPIEGLRASRPAWSSDGRTFAFVTTAGEGWQLRAGDLGTRRVRTLAGGSEPIRDVRWHPDGKRLGYLEGETLVVGGETRAHGVRRFAGWSSDGAHVAWVVPDPHPLAPPEFWSFLLPPQALARERVLIDGEPVFSGMRVTFPCWSPAEAKLSVWFTFAPTHRTPISRLFGWGLQPGDPAAILAIDGTVAWMPVNAFEEAQVGHCELLHGDAAGALARYEKAAAVPDEAPRDLALFRSVCLARLGRAEEARAELARFRDAFRPQGWESGIWFLGPFDPQAFGGKLIRELYVAEAFLALDAAHEAEAYFADGDPDEGVRLAKRVVLGQILLLEGRHAEYAELATEIAPEFFRRLRTRKRDEPVADAALLLHHAPLEAPEFLATLPEASAEALLPRWRAIAGETDRAAAIVNALEQRLGLRKPSGSAGVADLRELLSMPWTVENLLSVPGGR